MKNLGMAFAVTLLAGSIYVVAQTMDPPQSSSQPASPAPIRRRPRRTTGLTKALAEQSRRSRSTTQIPITRPGGTSANRYRGGQGGGCESYQIA